MYRRSGDNNHSWHSWGSEGQALFEALSQYRLTECPQPSCEGGSHSRGHGYRKRSHPPATGHAAGDGGAQGLDFYSVLPLRLSNDWFLLWGAMQ